MPETFSIPKTFRRGQFIVLLGVSKELDGMSNGRIVSVARESVVVQTLSGVEETDLDVMAEIVRKFLERLQEKYTRFVAVASLNQ